MSQEPYDDNFEHEEVFVSLSDVFSWCLFNITYISDEEKWYRMDYWQYPAVTYADRSGDCEDIALLEMYFFREIGIETKMIIVEYPETLRRHAILFISGTLYDINGAVFQDLQRVAGVLEYEKCLEICSRDAQ
jgi:hypothetical protein